ncbi:DUF6886 family protein [Tardiphaga sp.]|uniref:DUF6886 family protein n=1 Tax=Tardiphaga sp. TaxID=1926292 RepID=UPI002635EA69|nr:DUF6886 family protein [Tardiphaga sp.]
MQLFHFSDAGGIEVFTPRPVKVAAPRAEGSEWLNGPLVWAVDDWHQAMYLFPRECPRVFAWPVSTTTPQDRQAFNAITSCRMVAHIERRWFDRLSRAKLYRYALPQEGFEPLGDAGMWIARSNVTPTSVDRIDDIPRALERAGVELRILPSLQTLQPLWSTSLHVSAIGLRKALH